MIVPRNSGMGLNPAEQAALQFDPTLSAIMPSSGIDFGSLSTAAAGALNTPISFGQSSSAPLWAFLGVAISMLWLVTSAARVTKRAAHKVGSRAKKIKRGFTA